MLKEHNSLLFWTVLLGLSGATWFVYSQGVHGDFLFDDFANLPALGTTGPVTNWATFFRYITSGTADPTGRPLTLLTFLIDGRDWPTAAYPFKRTNLIIHLINSALLAALLVQLGKKFFGTSTAQVRTRLTLAALTTAAAWMIHPLFVSTVLYVVQREAMLPMTFVLIGLLLWLHGRKALMKGRLTSGLSLIVLGLFVCTCLAVLSKANGVLLPTYALLIEYLLLRHTFNEANESRNQDNQKGKYVYRLAIVFLAWVPTLIVLCYLFYVGYASITHGIDRPWTLGQRLLTEPRVLLNYLDLLWLPHPFTTGLFNDQYVPSTTLWSPPSTIFSLIGVFALLAMALVIRRRYPPLSLAIFFYFAGQLLESTTIPLELYYEHRNYIPAMLMFWPLSLWLWDVARSEPSSWSRPKIAFAGLIIIGLATMTRARADLWGDTQQQSLLWATLNPASARAQANAANFELSNNQAPVAERRMLAVLKQHPNDPQIIMNILSAHCQMGGITDRDLVLAKTTLATMRSGEQVIYHWLGNAIELSATKDCPGLTSESVSAMLDAADLNPRLNGVVGRMQDIYHLRGELALSQHHPAVALAWFEKGVALRPDPQMAFEQAAMLGSAGYPAAGLNQLQSFVAIRRPDEPIGFGMPSIHSWVLRRQNYWNKELDHLRSTLQDDLRQQLASQPSKGA
jgi:hypothetical protein